MGKTVASCFFAAIASVCLVGGIAILNGGN